MSLLLYSRFSQRLGLIAVASLVFCGWSCAWPVAEDCERYLSCRASFEAAFALPLADVSDYEAGGRCWDTPQNATLCREYCLQGIAEMQAAAREAGEELVACR